jgi:hypothetical protein
MDLINNQAKTHAAGRIKLEARGRDGHVIYVHANDPINPRGANAAVVMPSGALPAPPQDQGKANLPPSAFPANLRGSVTNKVMVTDSKGNLIPYQNRVQQ